MILQVHKVLTTRGALFTQRMILYPTILIILLMMTLLAACASSETEPLFPTVPGFGADTPCLFAEKGLNEAVVIRSLSDFEAYQDCMNSTADFDFTSHTLVAIRLQGGGCEFPKFRIIDIKTDELNQIITIFVEVKEKGKCAILHQTMRWVAIDPVPDGYKVIVKFN